MANTGQPVKGSLQIAIMSQQTAAYSWVSLGYFVVNLSGGQPKMY